MELLSKISFLILAALFTGVVLFLSIVLRATFNALTEEQYYAVFSKIIVAGRKSIVIIAIFSLVGLSFYNIAIAVSTKMRYT
jgi:succinate dehydrogenase/fumarate reductase cytochrome b subunit